MGVVPGILQVPPSHLGVRSSASAAPMVAAGGEVAGKGGGASSRGAMATEAGQTQNYLGSHSYYWWPKGRGRSLDAIFSGICPASGTDSAVHAPAEEPNPSEP